MFSRKELRTSVITTSRQTDSQIGSLVNEFMNLTLSEINDPGWAFPKQNVNHLWSWLRRKTTFSTVASTGDYVLGRDVDHIALMRQTATPVKLDQIRDELFFKLVPNPTDTGNPRFYRMWVVDGVAVRLDAADTINVVSDSNNDAGSAELAISVSGYDSNGIWITETYQLNGTTAVSGSKTFAAREIVIGKQKDTTGTITISEASGSTTLLKLGPDERTARFKVISLYPIPSSAITIYVEYYTRIPSMENDSDTPMLDIKWHYVVRLGALSKVYQYLNKEIDFTVTQQLYASAVKAMVAADRTNPDLIEHLEPTRDFMPFFRMIRSQDAIS